MRVRMPPRIWIWSNIRNSVNQIYALSFGSHFFDSPMIIMVSSFSPISTIFYGIWCVSYPSKQTHDTRSPQGSAWSEASDSDPSLRSEYEPVCALSSALLVPQLVAALQLILTKDISKGGCFMFRVYEKNRRLGCGGCDNLYVLSIKLDMRKIIHLQYTVKQPKDPKWSTDLGKDSGENCLWIIQTLKVNHCNACQDFPPWQCLWALRHAPWPIFTKSKGSFGPKTGWWGQIRKHVLWTLRWMMLSDFLCQELLVNHFGVPLHGNSHIIKTTLSCAWLPIATLSTLLSKAHAVCHRLVRILQAGVGDGHAR